MTIIDSKTLMKEFVHEQELHHSDPEKYRGYKFPMPWFMRMTGGWQREGLNFVYGQAGVGKSSVLITAAAEMGRNGVKFLYITLEESLSACMQRLVSNIEPVDRTHFRDICLDKTEWANLYQAANIIGGFNSWWADGLFSEKEISDAIRQVKPDVVFLDYMQLMTMPGKTMTEQVSAGSKFLKRITMGKVLKDVKIAVIAAAQANEQDSPLGSRDPDRDGDLVCEIRKIDDGNGGSVPGKRHFRIRKMRNGGDGQIDIAFFGGRSLVGELAIAPNVGKIRMP